MGLKRQLDLDNDKISTLMAQYAIPAIIGVTFMALNSAIDGVYLGRLAENSSLAVAGLGLVNPLLLLLTGIGQALSNGIAALCGMSLGKRDKEGFARILGSGMVLIFLIGITATLSLALGGMWLIQLLGRGASEGTLGFAGQYLRVYLFGIVFHIAANGLNNILNILGKPRLRMTGIIIQAMVNLILDPIFIFRLDMGMRGAALATVLSYVASTLWFSYHIFRAVKLMEINVKRKGHTISPAVFSAAQRIIKMSLPVLLASLTEAITLSCFTYTASSLGDSYLALYTAFSLLMTVFTFAVLGFSTGVSPLVSYNYGAGSFSRVRTLMRSTVGIASAYAFLVLAVFLLAPEIPIGIIIQDAALLEMGRPLFRLFFMGFMFMQFCTMGQIFFVAANNWRAGFLVVLVRKIVFLIPLIFILTHFFGAPGLFIAEGIGDVAGGIVAIALLLRLYRGLNNRDERQEAGN